MSNRTSKRNELQTFIDHEGIKPTLQTYLHEGFNVLLVGNPGIGKTTLINELAGGKENLMTVIGSKMLPSDLVGRMTLVNGETVWCDGLLTTAVRTGKWFYLDELSGLDDACQRILYSVIDGRRSLSINANSEEITAHKDFRFIASDNFSPTGIPSGSRAFRDRFVHVYLNRLDAETEAKLLISQYDFDGEDADWLMAFAAVTRRVDKDGGATTRQLELCARAIVAGVPRQTAAAHTLLGSIAGNSRPQLEQLGTAIRAEGLDLDEAWLSAKVDQFAGVEFAMDDDD